MGRKKKGEGKGGCSCLQPNSEAIGEAPTSSFIISRSTKKEGGGGRCPPELCAAREGDRCNQNIVRGRRKKGKEEDVSDRRRCYLFHFYSFITKAKKKEKKKNTSYYQRTSYLCVYTSQGKGKEKKGGKIVKPMPIAHLRDLPISVPGGKKGKRKEDYYSGSMAAARGVHQRLTGRPLEEKRGGGGEKKEETFARGAVRKFTGYDGRRSVSTLTRGGRGEGEKRALICGHRAKVPGGSWRRCGPPEEGERGRERNPALVDPRGACWASPWVSIKRGKGGKGGSPPQCTEAPI